ncbi:MAG TPA: response regulator [Cyclobacteriaceae bacterium]
MKKLNCIMLIDDNPDDNFFHERVIRKCDAAENIIVMQAATVALEYLQSKPDMCPDLIFLDINMPGMNGWEFLEEYNKLDKSLQSRVIVIMLTTSENPDDQIKAVNIVTDFKTKPLTKEMLEEIITTHF